jgi:nitrogen regulatory protein P-II 1
MKEIKAYIRTSHLNQTVEALKEKGAPGTTVVSVHPVGYDFGSRFTLCEVELSKKYYDVSKIELVCDKDDLDTYVNTILDIANTGSSGDGLIFVSEVEEVYKIRTRKRGTKIAELYKKQEAS